MERKVISLVCRPNLILYYDAENNVMRDMNEYVIFDIFKYISPNELLIFKEEKQNMVVFSKTKGRVTLLYID